MHLFINDVPLTIINEGKLDSIDHFDVAVNNLSDISDDIFHDDLLVTHANGKILQGILKKILNKKYKNLGSITISTPSPEKAINYLRGKFKTIRAGGGVVARNDEYLLIYKFKKWDLPKGKLEKGEKVVDGAIREVEEECCVKIIAREKICDTWHTYTLGGRRKIKETAWYLMECLDDSEMKPLYEESIEDVRWLNRAQLKEAMYNSYPSIRYVFKEYFKMIKEEKKD